MPAVLEPERTTQRHSRPVPVTRPHWSYSQISQFLRCPLSYYFERILKLERPFVSSAMALGSAVHEGLAEYHRRLQLNEAFAAGHIQETFLNAWQASEDRQPIQFKDCENRDDVLAQGTALLELYMQEPPPQDIVAIEEAMMVPLFTSRGECLEKPLIAVLDLLHRDEHGLLVSEFKTSGRRYSELETEMMLQATTYTHAVQQRYDQKPGVRYVVLVKTKKPQVQYLETVGTETDINRLGDVVQAVERAIQAEAWAFRTSKSTLEVRPVFVRKESRTRGHVFVVMLAYQIIKELADCWRDLDLTPREGVQELTSLCMTEVTIEGQTTINQIPTPRDSVQALLTAARVDLPPVLPYSGTKVYTKKKLTAERQPK